MTNRCPLTTGRLFLFCRRCSAGLELGLPRTWTTKPVHPQQTGSRRYSAAAGQCWNWWKTLLNKSVTTHSVQPLCIITQGVYIHFGNQFQDQCYWNLYFAFNTFNTFKCGDILPEMTKTVSIVWQKNLEVHFSRAFDSISWIQRSSLNRDRVVISPPIQLPDIT